MSVTKATVGAIVFSGTALLMCLYAVSCIYNDVQSIWAELDNEMDGFKVPKLYFGMRYVSHTDRKWTVWNYSTHFRCLRTTSGGT